MGTLGYAFTGIETTTRSPAAAASSPVAARERAEVLDQLLQRGRPARVAEDHLMARRDAQPRNRAADPPATYETNYCHGTG